MLTQASLKIFGLPQVTIYRDRRLYDSRRGKFIHPQSSTGHIEIANPETHERVRLSFEKVYGYFFRAPWRNGIDNRWLKPFGFKNYFATADGRIFSRMTWNYLVGNMSFDGYKRVIVKRDSGGFITIGIHRLVAMAYLPNPENKPEVNHKDGNKLNNAVTNLEWVWGWQNVDHARKHGLRKAAITDDQIHEICRLLENGKRNQEIAREMGIGEHHIRDIQSGSHFRISKNYDIPRTKYFGSGLRGRKTSEECYRIARKTHAVNLQPSLSNEEGSETIPGGSRDKCPEAVATFDPEGEDIVHSL